MTGELWNVTQEEYHADTTRISGSMLEDFRSEGPTYYWRKYIKRDLAPEPPSDAMIMGTAVDLAVLTPDIFNARVVKAPKFDRRTKEGKASALAFEESNRGRICLEPDDYERARAIARAVWANPVAADMLAKDNAKIQQAMAWDEPLTGLKLKALPDYMHGDVLADLKTTRCRTPDEFIKDCIRYGYHRKAALYAQARRAVLNHPTGRYLLITVTNSEPYVCAVYELPETVIELGILELEETISEINRRIAQNDWMPEGYNAITSLPCPQWVAYRVLQDSPSNERIMA